MLNNSLLPKLLEKNEASYKTVEELYEVLKNAEQQEIKNIALTGPYGSGKSSVLQTLKKNYGNKFSFLNISLATLQANTESKKNVSSPNDKKEQVADNHAEEDNSDKVKSPNPDSKKTPEEIEEERTEKLNRKIEYSILQQIIYREKSETVPNSRFRRIMHMPQEDIEYLAGCFLGTVIALLMLFKPSFARIEDIYFFFNKGQFSNFFDGCAGVWLCYVVYNIAKYIVKSYSNSKLNKLNLKDGEIEVIEDNSIFNKHLDEILYFFQVTDYNVVIIEDLDRFGTSNIFLKLRELNQIINESKVVDRHITFVYAIKDDVFEDEERTKFFDYITTVIPVINPSNSKDKLKEALDKAGYAGDNISDNDLTDIAFFIQDMRILLNIVNEYGQYRDKLQVNSQANLNYTKLLAMIVYKNYNPQDFAMLHRREGKVYKCLSLKPEFEKIASRSIDQKIQKLQKEKDLWNDNCHLKVTELRLLALYAIRDTINSKMFQITINGDGYSFAKIAKDKNLFDTLIASTTIYYSYYYGYNSTSSDSSSLDFANIDKTHKFLARIKVLESGISEFETKEEELQTEKNKIHTQSLSQLLSYYTITEEESFKDLGLTELMQLFLLRGHIDEDYYDYISYFYEGMISSADRELLLNIKMQKMKPADTKIDKVENFTKQLLPYNFNHDCILNNDLLDYLSHNKENDNREYFMMFMRRILKSTPLAFLAQYYKLGKQNDVVFPFIISKGKDKLWNSFVNCKEANNKDSLIEAWLKYCHADKGKQSAWLNENYDYLCKHADAIGLDQCEEFITHCVFTNLVIDGHDEIMKNTICYNAYAVNLNNLFVVTKYLGKSEALTKDNLNLSRIIETKDENFVPFVNDHLIETLKSLKDVDKDEVPAVMVDLLNNEDIPESIKETYLEGQHNKIEDIADIRSHTMKDKAMSLNLLAPTWSNIDAYYSTFNELSDVMKQFITRNVVELSNSSLDNNAANREDLFNSILGSDLLSEDIHKQLVNCIDDVFDGYNELQNLSSQRLRNLLFGGKIPYTSKNTEIIDKTNISYHYFEYHHQKLVKDFSVLANVKPLTIKELLKSNAFTIDEKSSIIDSISESKLSEMTDISDVLISIILHKKEDSFSTDLITSLLRHAYNKENALKLLVLILKKSSINNNDIDTLLDGLGGSYADIANRSKKPAFELNELNRSLLSLLKDLHYISSFSAEKDKLRVNHFRQN